MLHVPIRINSFPDFLNSQYIMAAPYKKEDVIRGVLCIHPADAMCEKLMQIHNTNKDDATNGKVKEVRLILEASNKTYRITE